MWFSVQLALNLTFVTSQRWRSMFKNYMKFWIISLLVRGIIEICLNIGIIREMSIKYEKWCFFINLDKITLQHDPRDTPLGCLKFWKLVKMLANALDLCAQPMRVDKFLPNFMALALHLFWRTVLTKWRFYGQNTVQMADNWNSCKT